MFDKIDCLDHGFVRLVDHMGSDLSVVRSARVSYDAAWRAGENEKSDARLIKYLWDHKHMTPFEAATLTLEVKAPIFVFRQWHRHRTQSYNEVSARYTELPDEFYIPRPEDIGEADPKNRQGRVLKENRVAGSGLGLQREQEIEDYIYACKEAFKFYHNFLEDGWPRELARMVLPLSTYSHMFTTMNLRNFFHFIELRLDSHAQYEIRVYAEASFQLVKQYFPVCCDAFLPDSVTYEMAAP